MSRADPDAQLRRLTRAVLIGCLAVVLATAALVASPRLRQTLGLTDESPGYRVGERIDTPPETYAASPYTLILFARENCAACRAAQSFLKDIVGQLAGSLVAVSVITPQEKRAEEVEYVRGLGLSEARLFPLTVRDLKVRAIPTAVLVDERGVILGASRGLGDPLRELSAQALAKAH